MISDFMSLRKRTAYQVRIIRDIDTYGEKCCMCIIFFQNIKNQRRIARMRSVIKRQSHVLFLCGKAANHIALRIVSIWAFCSGKKTQGKGQNHTKRQSTHLFEPSAPIVLLCTFFVYSSMIKKKKKDRFKNSENMADACAFPFRNGTNNAMGFFICLL